MAGEPLKMNSKYLAHLDGWRGHGIIVVMFYHMGFTLCRHGWLCISLFFVLSGLLITGITVNQFEKHGRIDVVRFWSRRVGRLLPALLLLITMVAVVSKFQDLDSEDIFYLRGDLLWGLFYFENVHLINKQEDYFAGFQKPSVMRHVWTLAVEEQYYLFWPIIFWMWLQLQRPSIICGGDKNGCVERGDGEVLRNVEKIESETDTPSPAVDCSDLPPIIEDSKVSRTSPALRKTLKTLCFGELLVIVLSYWSSHVTIQEMGMSAAYFSTWSRCGDFACGGLTYLLIHLNPKLRARYLREGPLEPMSLRFKICCELCHAFGYLVVIVIPMMQAPLAEVLPFYFYVWRLPFSMFVVWVTVAGAMLSSEPLPKWAIVTRWLSSRFMVLIGIVSYGVYLFHWPFILWMGKPMNHDAFEAKENAMPGSSGDDEGNFWLELLRDFGIAALSTGFGLFSFFVYEKPLMIYAGKAKRPWKVLFTGLLSSLAVAGIVLVCTQGGQDPNTADDEWADFGLAVPVPKKSHPTFSADITGISTGDSKYPPLKYWKPPEDARDSRKTPIGFLTPVNSGMTIYDILDHNTIGPHRIGGTRHNHDEGDGYPIEFEASDITAETAEKGRTKGSNVIFACRGLYLANTDSMDAIKEAHPCNEKYSWFDNTTWVWVRSNLLCGVSGYQRPAHKEPVVINEAEHRHYFESVKCPHKVRIALLDIPDWLYWEPEEAPLESLKSYSGRQDRDAYLLMEMILAGAALVPDAINKESLTHFHEQHEKDRAALEKVAVFVDDNGLIHSYMEGDAGMITIELMGDSVAHKIGLLMKELLSVCVAADEGFQSSAGGQALVNPGSLETPEFPQLIVSNRAMSGEVCVQHYIPCVADCQGAAIMTKECQVQQIECEEKKGGGRTDVYTRTHEAIGIVQPEFLILQDGHWFENEKERNTFEITKETWYVALELFLKNAQDVGVQRVFLMTNSPLHPSYEAPGKKDKAFREIAERNRCHGGEKGMMLSVYEWHKLICPSYDHVTECSNRNVHGFEFILEDLLHPKGASGNWLVAQVLSSMLRHIATADYHFSPEAAYEIPLVECLVNKYPPDHDPELDDIIVDLGAVCL